MLWKFFITNVVPVLYVVGMFYVVAIQGNRIRSLKDAQERSRDRYDELEKYVSIKLPLLEKSSKAKEEAIEREWKELVASLLAKVNEDKTKMSEITKRMIDDYIQLLIPLFRALADTWLLEKSINDLPEGIVKHAAIRLREGLRAVIEETRNLTPLMGIMAAQLANKSDAPKIE